MDYTVVKLNNEIIHIRCEKGFVPISEDNSDYQKYLEWVAEGNEASIEEI